MPVYVPHVPINNEEAPNPRPHLGVRQTTTPEVTNARPGIQRNQFPLQCQTRNLKSWQDPGKTKVGIPKPTCESVGIPPGKGLRFVVVSKVRDCSRSMAEPLNPWCCYNKVIPSLWLLIRNHEPNTRKIRRGTTLDDPGRGLGFRGSSASDPDPQSLHPKP